MKNIIFVLKNSMLHKALFLSFAFILSSISTSTAATDELAESLKSEQADVEIIAVEGERHFTFYRRNLHKAEDRFFSMMNDLLTEEDFKVTCETRRMQAFTRLKARTCEANFVSRLTGEKTQKSFDSLSAGKRLRGAYEQTTSFDVPTSVELRKSIEKRKKEYLEELVKQINSNPELLKAFNELQIAKQKYEQYRE